MLPRQHRSLSTLLRSSRKGLRVHLHQACCRRGIASRCRSKGLPSQGPGLGSENIQIGRYCACRLLKTGFGARSSSCPGPGEPRLARAGESGSRGVSPTDLRDRPDPVTVNTASQALSTVIGPATGFHRVFSACRRRPAAGAADVSAILQKRNRDKAGRAVAPCLRQKGWGEVG